MDHRPNSKSNGSESSGGSNNSDPSRSTPVPKTVSDGNIVRCTACGDQINVNIRAEFDPHPRLFVVICKKCAHFLEQGEWTKDDEGMDEYCTWCGQGGTVIGCDACQTTVFCTTCLHRNFGRGYVNSAKNDEKWTCLVCDPKPLEPLVKEMGNYQLSVDANSQSKRSQRNERPGRAPSRKAVGGDDSNEASTSTAANEASTSTAANEASTSTAANDGRPSTPGMRSLPRLFRVAIDTSTVFKSAVEAMHQDLISVLDSDNADNESKLDASSQALTDFSSSIAKMKEFCDEMSNAISGRLCVRTSYKCSDANGRPSASYEWIPQRPPSSSPPPPHTIATRSDVGVEQRKRKRSPDPPEVSTKKRRFYEDEQDNDGEEEDESGESQDTVNDAQEESNDVDERHPEAGVSAVTVASGEEENSNSNAVFEDADVDLEMDMSDQRGEENATLDHVEKDAQSLEAPSDQLQMASPSPELQSSGATEERALSVAAESVSNDGSTTNQGESASEQIEFAIRKIEYCHEDSNDGNSEDLEEQEPDELLTPEGDEVGSPKENDEIGPPERNYDDLRSPKASSDELESRSPDEDDANSPDEEDTGQNAFFAAFDDDDDRVRAPSQARSDVSDDLDEKDLVSDDLDDDHDGAEISSNEDDDEDADVEEVEATIIDSPTQSVETKGESKVASGDELSTDGSNIAKERESEDGDINAGGDEVEKTRTSKRHDNTKDDGYNAELEKDLRALQRDLRVDLPGDDKRSRARNLESAELSIPKAKNSDKNVAAGSVENPIDDVDDSEDSEDDQSPKPDNTADYFQEFTIPLARIDENANSGNEFFDAFDSDDESDQSDDANKANDQTQSVKRKPVVKPQQEDKNQSVVYNISSDEDEDEEEENVPKTKAQLEREAALRTNFGAIPSDEPSKKRTHDGSKRRLRTRSGKRILSDTEDDDNQSTNSDATLTLSSGDEATISLSDSDADDDDDEEMFANTRRLDNVKQDLSFSQNSLSPSKGNGRRNIRPINDGSLATQEAEKAEKERRRRLDQIKKEHKGLNASQGDAGTSADAAGPVVLLDPLAEPPVKIHPRLASQLKKHQIAGVEFMFQATIESVKTFKKGEQPGGCILAHCMGLGKTFQVIAYLHAVMTYAEFNLRTAMIIVPVNVLTNWDDEFRKWLASDSRILETIEIFGLTDVKSLRERIQRLQSWQEDGGVLIIGYDIFRLLVSEEKPVSPHDEPKKRKREKKLISEEDRKALQHCLLDPGADIVICDEGHKLKNDKAGVSDAVKKIKTKRRICLTGTPLQNNLTEYHCMVDFVKPKLLGTKVEFRNRFENPIKNGTYGDSSEDDVRRMKRQAHVLHRSLKGCVHRLDYSVLTPDLPPRHEYILFCRLSKMQVELYETYLQNVVGGVDVDDLKRLGKRLLGDFQVFQRICAHPLMLKMHQDSNSNKKKPQSDENVETDEAMDVDPGDDDLPGPSHGGRRSCDKDPLVPRRTPTPAALLGWWKNVISKEEDAAELDMSGKFVLLMEIIWRCEMRGEKLLVFSQKLLTLDLIEMFLEYFDDFIDKYHNETESDKAHRKWRREERWKWRPDKDYMRLDGTCATKKRQESINMFNTDPRCRLFLISTKAGSMGTNLVGASRVVIFDASWNPSDDAQAIFRVYRYGQTKEVFIYRFVSTGTMENVIYDRQVNKQSLALRVVDEHQIARHFTSNDLEKLYTFDPQSGNKEVPVVPEDALLCDLLLDAKQWLDKYHEHTTLLCNVEEDELTDEEKLSAWDDYQHGRDCRQQPANPAAQAAMAGTSTNNAPLGLLYLHSFAECLKNPSISNCFARGNTLLRSCGMSATMENLCEKHVADIGGKIALGDLLNYALGLIKKATDVLQQKQQQSHQHQRQLQMIRPPNMPQAQSDRNQAAHGTVQTTTAMTASGDAPIPPVQMQTGPVHAAAQGTHSMATLPRTEYAQFGAYGSPLYQSARQPQHPPPPQLDQENRAGASGMGSQLPPLYGW